jgi:hypothetical protein
MSLRIEKVRTVEHVQDDDRRYPEEYAMRIRAELLKLKQELGTEAAAGKALDGLSQSGFHRAIKEGNQPSLRVLLSLAKYRNCSVDSILGLSSATAPTASEIAAKVLEGLGKRPSSAPPESVERPSRPPRPRRK